MTTNRGPPLHPLEHDGWKSDHFLSDQSAREFRELHRTVSASLEQLDGEIARIKAVLDGLLCERALYTSRIDKIASAVASHKKLPVEILSQAFSHTIDQPICIVMDCNAFKTYDMPVSSQVCGRWRQVTLATQKQWESIEMICSIGDWEHSDAIIRIAHTIISRGAHFIKLRLNDTRGGRQAHHPSIPALVDILSRAKHIIFSTSSLPTFRDVLETSPPLFPTLEFVSLTNEAERTESIEKCCVFNNAPRLTKVHFKEYQYEGTEYRRLFVNPSFELPWGQLQDINFLVRITLPAAHSLLSRCPNLTKCLLKIRANHGQAPVSPSFPRGSITLHHLLSFSLYMRTDIFEAGELPGNARVLEPLVFPSLKALRIRPAYDNTWCSSITDLLHRSKCPLESLTVHGLTHNISGGALGALFDTLSPTLMRLDIESTWISVEMLARISQGSLFSHLKSLRCGINPTPSAFEGLMRLVRYRCVDAETEGISRILSVKVRHDNPPDDNRRFAGWADAVGRFKELAKEARKKGCKVYLTYTGL